MKRRKNVFGRFRDFFKRAFFKRRFQPRKANKIGEDVRAAARRMCKIRLERLVVILLRFFQKLDRDGLSKAVIDVIKRAFKNVILVLPSCTF